MKAEILLAVLLPAVPSLAASTGERGALGEVRVLELKFFPLEPGGREGRLDPAIAGTDKPLAWARRHVAETSAALAGSLREASVYIHDPEGVPSVSYRVVESLERLEPVPVSKPGSTDHSAMLDGRYTGGKGICSYVDDDGVGQVWIWMYHTGHAAPVESNMAMGTASSGFFNHGSYGDASNSYQTRDLPVCRRSYTVFEYSYTRGLGEALEDHGHQLEALFAFVDEEVFFSRYLRYGDSARKMVYEMSVRAASQDLPRAVHCGNVHSPPNTVKDYDWANPLKVRADCDWEGGEPEVVSCENWSCESDGGTAWKLWWMRRLPGRGNRVVSEGWEMRNWWEFVADLDEALAKGRSLASGERKGGPDAPREPRCLLPVHAKVYDADGSCLIEEGEAARALRDARRGGIPRERFMAVIRDRLDGSGPASSCRTVQLPRNRNTTKCTCCYGPDGSLNGSGSCEPSLCD